MYCCKYLETLHHHIALWWTSFLQKAPFLSDIPKKCLFRAQKLLTTRFMSLIAGWKAHISKYVAPTSSLNSTKIQHSIFLKTTKQVKYRCSHIDAHIAFLCHGFQFWAVHIRKLGKYFLLKSFFHEDPRGLSIVNVWYRYAVGSFTLTFFKSPLVLNK